MQSVHELAAGSTALIEELSEAIEREGIGLKEVEERIQAYLNRLGSLLEQEVVDRVGEPVGENRVWVDGEEAVFDQRRPLRFHNRFGGITCRRRRCYKLRHRPGGYYPLDERLGLDRCAGGFSPLLTYLQVLFGASRPFEESASLLSAALGFAVSSTAVQRNTEQAGERLADEPYRRIADAWQQRPCARLVVQMDSTTSPQIQPREGVVGRESLKSPTEYKMAHVGVLERLDEKGAREAAWTVSRYEPMEAFGQHLGRAGLRLGLEKAGEVVFLSDGLPANWQICLDHFPAAVEILDFYHAAEHLGAFCRLYREQERGTARFARWKPMLLSGEVLQVTAEMKADIPKLSNSADGWAQVRYFQNNRERMAYARYREAGLPIGSGKVEGACKYVVGKRFKGSGMRWKRADNQRVLRARLAKLNGYLESHYRPAPQSYTFSPPLEPAA
jgi:hypothetical protein